MPDTFVREYIGRKVTIVLAHEAGQWHGVLHEVGDQWIKIQIGKGQTTLFPIVNIRSVAVDDEEPVPVVTR